MAKRKQPAKRVLENPGDVSVLLAPAPPKKSKSQVSQSAQSAQPVQATSTKTRLATKQAKASDTGTDANDQGDGVNPTPDDVGAPKQRARPKVKAPSADNPAPLPEDDSNAAPPPTKAKKSNPPETLTITTTTSKSNDKEAPPPPKGKAKEANRPKELVKKTVPEPVSEPDEVVQLLSPSKKSNREKKPSEIAEKVKEQAAAKQKAKNLQAAKKAKKAEAAVISESPAETAAFLAKALGKQPEETSPLVASPPRKKLPVNRSKALGQLVSAHAPSPDPSLVSGVSAATGTSTRTSSIAPDDSVSQVNVPKAQKTAKSGLRVPSLYSTSRDVSPAAPPHLDPPASDVSPTPGSVATGDEDDFYEEGNVSSIDVNTLLNGIPKPFNLGPANMPPELPAPFHTAKLNEEAMKVDKSTKDKKPLRAAINNFRKQDQEHLKLNLEYMEDLILTVYAFPDDELCWTFGCLSNYWASKDLNRSYRITRDSEHYRLTRSKLVTAAMSDGIRDNYGLNWDLNSKDAMASQKRVQEKVADIIKSSSFLAPANKPTLYYQNPWFKRLLRLAYWTGSSSKGFSPRHAAHFSRVSYALLAFAVTAVEKQLAVVASGLTAAPTNHRNAVNAFSHEVYAERSETHLVTLSRLHFSPAGEKLTEYFAEMYEEFRGVRPAAVAKGPGPKLAIPLSAFNNYGVQPELVAEVRAGSSHSRHTPSNNSNDDSDDRIDVGKLLKSDLSDKQKIKILMTIYEQTAENPPSQTFSHTSRASRQYQGLFTEVNGDSDNSEVQARRAGALTDVRDRARPASEVQVEESDEEMAGVREDESNGDAAGEGGNGTSEPGSEAEAGSGGKVEAGAQPDSSMVVWEGEGDGADDEQVSPGDQSDDDHAPITPGEPNFLDAEGYLVVLDDSEDDESDGDGADGVVQAANGDQTMVTEAGSDDEE
ncbi:hypothetical protein FRC07_013952 [Ceratobasidium sp. 392]|nr:hypothetical protein FRC07_013952 [Ceratobasidium sp. 392]